MSATIKDIANIANVSYSTVSKALNHSPLVRNSTKKKITRIAEELNYQPNSAARQLVSKKTFIIGLIWPTINRKALSTLVSEINKQIEHTPYSMILSVEPIQKSLKTFERFQVDGIIYFDESFEKEPIKTNIPMVVYGTEQLDSELPTIDPNHKEAMLEAVKFLKKLGHTNIAYIGDLNSEDPRQTNKLEGFLKAMRDLRLPIKKEYQIDTKGLGWHSGYIVAKNVSTFHLPPTAIIGGSFDISKGIVRSVKEQGFAVPEDISIISYDNISQLENEEIALTCFGAPLINIAKNIVELLIQLIENPDYNRLKIKLKPTINKKGSCQDLNKK